MEQNVGALKAELKKEKNNVLDEDLECTKDQLLSSNHTVSPTLRTSECFRKDHPLLPDNDGIRTIEGSNLSDNRYTEYAEEFSKAEPAVVRLEYGVARMTC